MSIYIEAPDDFYQAPSPSIFFAGGTSDLYNWQKKMKRYLEETELSMLSPRRENFPVNDPEALMAQITWEHKAMRQADKILFWFPKDTLCPITLYELGSWSMTEKPIFIGIHTDYQRRQDVEMRISLSRPDIEIVYSLKELANQVMRAGAEVIDAVPSS